MASILTRRGKRGTTYQAIVRRRGWPTETRTFRRKTDAAKWARDAERDMDRGEFVSESAARSTLLSDLCLLYTNRAPLLDRDGEPILDGDGNPKLGGNPDYLDHPERDRRKEIGKLDWWVRTLGDPTLDRLLDGSLIRKALNDLRSGASPSGKPVSPATGNRYRAAIRQALAYGVEHKKIPRNPARGMRAGKEVERVRRLDVAERTRLLEACQRSEDRRLYPLVLLALASGGRRGELLGLTWSDLDLERNRVQFLNTKNGTHRGVGVSPAVLRVLRDRLLRHVSGLVFADDRGRPEFPRKAWEDALVQAKVEDFHFHDCRHDFASRLCESGASLAELAECLGHRTLAMVKRYSHLTEGHVADVTRRASEALL